MRAVVGVGPSPDRDADRGRADPGKGAPYGPSELLGGDGTRERFTFRPREKQRLGKAVRGLLADTGVGRFAVALASTDPTFSLGFVTGEAWPHVALNRGDTCGLVGDGSLKPAPDGTLAWRLEVHLGAETVPAAVCRAPEAPPHVYLDGDVGREFAVFHPDEAIACVADEVTMLGIAPVTAMGVGGAAEQEPAGVGY